MMRIISFASFVGLAVFFLVCLNVCFLSDVALAQAGEAPLISLLSPDENAEIIAKKPLISCSVAAPFSAETMLVILDGVDVTGILNITSDGFSFQPVEILLPGTHMLSVTINTPDGIQVVEDFSFKSRHSTPFETVVSRNEITAEYENRFKESSGVQNIPNYEIESNISHETLINEKKWEVSLSSNLRFLDQNLAIYPPMEKGINLANYLLKGNYAGETVQFSTGIGDVQINETQNTVNLSRRGGTFAVNHEAVRINTFVVNSEEVFGFKEGTGINSSTDDHIMGVSGEVGFLSDKVRFKTIYATGGENEDSYSMYSGGGDKKGNVLGFLLTSGFFDNRLNTEAELDFSEYDADTSDEFSDEKDKAYRLRMNGFLGSYSYDAMYEYLGPDYQVIGNQFLQRDKEGGAVNLGANYQVHSATVSFSAYNDNVDNDELYPRIYSYQGQLSYNFNKFPSLPMGLMYQRSILDSTDEPEFCSPMKTSTDTISGMVNYIVGSWNFGAGASYSDQNDKTLFNNDTDSANYSLSSSYFSNYVCISPGFSFNRSRYKLTGVRTDTSTISLDFRGTIWDQKITYACSGTFSRMKNSDNSMEQDSYNANARIAYLLARNLWGLLSPSVGLMGLFTETDDHVNHFETDDYHVLFVFSSSMPVVF